MFAIAVTLLIIDIRIPYHESFTDKQLLQATGDKVPQLFGFFISSIVLLPFTTSIFGMYGFLLTAFSFYILNAPFTGIMNFLCWRHILNPRRNLCECMEEASARRGAYVSSLTMPVWFFYLLDRRAVHRQRCHRGVLPTPDRGGIYHYRQKI